MNSPAPLSASRPRCAHHTAITTPPSSVPRSSSAHTIIRLFIHPPPSSLTLLVPFFLSSKGSPLDVPWRPVVRVVLVTQQHHQHLLHHHLPSASRSPFIIPSSFVRVFIHPLVQKEKRESKALLPRLDGLGFCSAVQLASGTKAFFAGCDQTRRPPVRSLHLGSPFLALLLRLPSLSFPHFPSLSSSLSLLSLIIVISHALSFVIGFRKPLHPHLFFL